MRATAFSILAAALGLASCTTPQRNSGTSIYAVVDQSEWVPPGFVRLDLTTGQYELKPQPPRRNPGASMPVQRGRLSPDQLRTFRQAYDAARTEGLRAPVCTLVVSNAGPISMELSGAGGLSTPEELGCWSDAALRLHQLLEELF